jgi:hypothetical protein
LTSFIFFTYFLFWFYHSTLYFFFLKKGNCLCGFFRFLFYWVIQILWLESRAWQINLGKFVLYYPGYKFVMLTRVNSSQFFYPFFTQFFPPITKKNFFCSKCNCFVFLIKEEIRPTRVDSGHLSWPLTLALSWTDPGSGFKTIIKTFNYLKTRQWFVHIICWWILDNKKVVSIKFINFWNIN